MGHEIWIIPICTEQRDDALKHAVDVLERAIDGGKIDGYEVIAVHVYRGRNELISYCRQRGIEAYCEDQLDGILEEVRKCNEQKLYVVFADVHF